MFLFERSGPYLADVDPAIDVQSADVSGRRAQWSSLRRYIVRTRPRIVVSFLSYFSVLTAAHAAATGALVVFNQQTPMSAFLADGDYPWRRGWRRLVFDVATRTGYAAADLIVTTSRGVAQDLVSAFGVRRKKIAVVPNPVDLAAVREASQAAIDPAHQAQWRRPVIVSAGRLAEAKNYPLLIDAFALVRRQIDARLFILGTGDQEGAIQQQIRSHGLEDSAILCGFQRNPWQYIGKADVFALSSHYEGFGNVLIEAMACGVPVVATASAGTRDIITNGVDGLLVARHEPAAMAEALLSMLCDEPQRARMATAAAASAERFDIDRVTRMYDAIFEGVLA